MYILADVGATKIRLAKSIDLSAFTDPIILDTPKDPAFLVDFLTTHIREIAGGNSIEAVALGVTRVLHLDVDALSRNLGCTVYAENDAALVGLGEAVYGAGKGFPLCVYITVSTGVNGVRIVRGAIEQSEGGFEIGAQYLDHGEHLQTLEDLVSGRALEKKSGMHPRELGKSWEGWEDLARILAIGVHNTILHWSPSIVVLGGSMMNEIGIPLERVDAHLKTIMKKIPTTPRLVHSSLGDFGGLWGGLARLRQVREM